MSDAAKWGLGVVATIIAGLTLTLSTRALFAVGGMRDSINAMRTEEPLKEQLRAIENEQMRQGMLGMGRLIACALQCGIVEP